MNAGVTELGAEVQSAVNRRAACQHDADFRRRHLDRAISRLQRRISRLERISERYSQVRLALFLGGGALVAGVFLVGRSTWGWMLLLAQVIVLSAVAYLHGVVKKGLGRHRLWLSIKRTHLARVDLDWSQIPPASTAGDGCQHPFNRDLDITGPQSLHQLLDCCLSDGGSALLGTWLLRSRPDLAWIHRRQALVRELAPLSLFRDKLALHGETSPSRPKERRLGSEGLFKWLADPSELRRLAGAVTVHALLAAGNLALFVLHLTGSLPSLWPVSSLACLGYFFSRQKHVESLFGDGLWLERTITRYRAVFRHLEGFGCRNQPHLAELCAPFFDQRTRPSMRLGAVARLVGALSVRAYFPAWILVNLLLPWDFFFAWRLQRQKEDLAELLPGWLAIWFELEASNSLACFAWLHPGYGWPEFDPSVEGFDGKGLGHPLITAGQRVTNDLRLRGRGQIVIVTGSNMAGKSTFLRTVGVNLCLAQAGGPVCASSLRCAPLRLHACIRVSDSLVEGFSYFYAEVRRLRSMLDELARDDEVPLLFLIDEIFKGTNNRERLIGSRSFIKALVNRNGLGLISTHDLELVRLSDDLETVSNRHFREDVVDGRMRFDYRLREGPCPTTNALKIMRLEGLPVEEA